MILMPLLALLGLTGFRWSPLVAWLWIWGVLVPVCHGVLQPRNPGDFQREAARLSRPPLQEGRPVLGVTSQARQSYLLQFSDWLLSIGVSLDDLLENHVSVCLTWGWLDMAGMMALSWGALLQVGEFTQATRADLLLPVNTGFTNQFALLALKEPKTRFTIARHQTAKLDIPDLSHIDHIAFSRLQPSQKLWPRSGQTLRNRFQAIMSELGITPETRLNGKGLDLASLRPGGATWLIQTTENGELTRRRGRWVKQRVVGIYIQEVSCFQFLATLSESSRSKVLQLCFSYVGAFC